MKTIHVKIMGTSKVSEVLRKFSSEHVQNRCCFGKLKLSHINFVGFLDILLVLLTCL